MDGSFADEETARGYYPSGVFDFMKNAMEKDGLPDDEALKYRYYFNGVHEYALTAYDLFAHKDTHAAGLEIAKHVGNIVILLNLLGHICDGTDPEQKTAIPLQAARNALGNAARAFERINYGYKDKLEAHGTYIGDSLIRYAAGLAKLQNVFDTSVGAALGALRDRN